MARFFDSLGDPEILATALLPFLLWLWTRGAAQATKGVITGIAIVVAATVVLKWIAATPGTSLWPDGSLFSQYFPSGHAAIATAVYGSVAILLAAAGGGSWRYAPLGALTLSVAVAGARVALRLHPIGDVFVGVLVGLASPIATYTAALRDRARLPAAGSIFLVFLAAYVAGRLLPAPLHGWLR
jgi:membrane-associated phospholipid phosphatase